LGKPLGPARIEQPPGQPAPGDTFGIPAIGGFGTPPEPRFSGRRRRKTRLFVVAALFFNFLILCIARN
jgi:hypothetical protein